MVGDCSEGGVWKLSKTNSGGVDLLLLPHWKSGQETENTGSSHEERDGEGEKNYALMNPGQDNVIGFKVSVLFVLPVSLSLQEDPKSVCEEEKHGSPNRVLCVAYRFNVSNLLYNHDSLQFEPKYPASILEGGSSLHCNFLPSLPLWLHAGVFLQAGTDNLLQLQTL